VVWERAGGQAIQVLLTVAVLFALPSPVRSSMPFLALGLVAAAVALVLVVRVQKGRGHSRLARAWSTAVADVRVCLLNRRALPAIVLGTTVAVIGHVLTFVIVARAVGVTAPVTQLVPLAFLSIMAMALPNIGGWGPREGVTAWAFSAAGLSAGAGAATAVAYGIAVLAASLPGGVVLLLEQRSRRRSKSKAEALLGPWSRQQPQTGRTS
jgi:hypothetical protein